MARPCVNRRFGGQVVFASMYRATNTMRADWDSWFAPVDTDPALHSHRMKLLLNGQLWLKPKLVDIENVVASR
jgi:hypothetical protein